MSAQDGKMTPEETARALKWLNEKTKSYACPVCQTNNWHIGDRLIQGTVFYQGTTMLGGPTYPMVFVTCVNCAYTRHFMAIQMGVVTSDVPENKPTKSEG